MLLREEKGKDPTDQWFNQSCLCDKISGAWKSVNIWVCGRYLWGSFKTVWAYMLHPCLLQAHRLFLPTCSTVCTLIVLHNKTVSMYDLMSSLKYSSKLNELGEEAVGALGTATQKHRSHSTSAVEDQSCWTSLQLWDLILSPNRHCQNITQGHCLVSAGELISGWENCHKLLILEVLHWVVTWEWD